MAYGPYRRIGVFAGKVLQGANPAALPIERPTKFELILNLRTADALGLSVPASLLLRADEVIE
jgi:putative ABC transport system substrate-binding protein